MITLGILADTHVPDRKRELNPEVLDVFRQGNVGAILHAGDISTASVLSTLEQIAPVYAVRGNRDWVALKSLPANRLLTFNGVQVGLTHGHGNLRRYLIKRIEYIFQGYDVEMFLPVVRAQFPTADVMVFGHTHRPYAQHENGRLILNPGSPHVPEGKKTPPSVALLHIQPGGEFASELVNLESI